MRPTRSLIFFLPITHVSSVETSSLIGTSTASTSHGITIIVLIETRGRHVDHIVLIYKRIFASFFALRALSSLRAVQCLQLLLEEGGDKHEKLVNALPIFTFFDVCINYFLTGHIFFEKIDNSVQERSVVRRHHCIEGHALFCRILVIVLLDGDITATDSDHAVFTARRDLFAFSTDQIGVLLLQLDNWHEGAEQLAKHSDIVLAENVDRKLFVLTFGTLTIQINLRLLHLLLDLVNENRVDFIRLFAFLEQFDLEVGVPEEALENLINGNVTLKHVIWVLIEIDLFEHSTDFSSFSWGSC